MAPTIFSIDHNIIKFSMEPGSGEFKKQGTDLVTTAVKRYLPEFTKVIIYKGKYAIKYVVNLIARQSLNDAKNLLEINLKSTFIFSATKETPSDEFWCRLILKALEGLRYSYYQKTKGTYLENVELKITKTMKKDCLKQRQMDRIAISN